MALRSSRTSFSSSLIRCASSVVVPGLRPPSTWAFLTQVRRASGWTPSSSPILRIAPLARAGSANASNAILVARSRSSSGHFLKSHDSEPSISSLPLTNPGRFRWSRSDAPEPPRTTRPGANRWRWYPGLLPVHDRCPARAGRRLDPRALGNREPAPLSQRRHLRRGPPPATHR